MRKFLVFGIAIVATAVVFFIVGRRSSGTNGGEAGITPATVSSAEKIIGIDFTPAERDSMIDDLTENLDSYRNIRTVTIENSTPPALRFEPLPIGIRVADTGRDLSLGPLDHAEVPADIEDLAFWSVRDLGELIRTRRITSSELTKMYLRRLEKYGPTLECVVTITRELALQQAARADEEIAKGKYRGPLHGIPYGAKDLFAVKGYRTTWGAEPYKDQEFDRNAVVI
ncbi:MAG: amidase family protein, partial [bacterium]